MLTGRGRTRSAQCDTHENADRNNRPGPVEILAQLRTYNFGPAAAYCVVLLALILVVVGGADWFQRRLAARGVTGGE